MFGHSADNICVLAQWYFELNANLGMLKCSQQRYLVDDKAMVIMLNLTVLTISIEYLAHIIAIYPGVFEEQH